MIDVRPVLFVVGVMILTLVPLMWLCAIVDYAAQSPDWLVFVGVSALSLMLGSLLAVSTRRPNFEFDRRQAFLLTVLMWVAMSVVGGLPLYFSQFNLTFAQSVFEAASGITTTGSTVIVGLDTAPPGVLLWRGLLQWVGGLGFIATGILLFPFLRIAGMQLFKMESSDVGDKATARMIDTVRQILFLYVLATLLGIIAFMLFTKATFLEAVVHCMAAISTGGFSTSDSSVGYFQSRAVEAILMVLMLVGSLTFPLMIQVFSGRTAPLLQDPQTRFYLNSLIAIIALISIWRWLDGQGDPVRIVWSTAFNVISVVTTTGFASEDYLAWGVMPISMFLLITVLGGCTGSTSGGIKAFRLYVLLLAIKAQLATRLYPHQMVRLRYGSRVIDEDVVRSIMVFIWLFFFSLAIVTIGVSWTGIEPLTALSAAAQALANVGPGITPLIGPVGNFSTINDTALWFLTAGMLLGRLEIVVVLVIFMPRFWRG